MKHVDIRDKIEQQMIAAINNNQNWQSANTTVLTEQNGISTVYLHGNKIAEIGDDYMTIYDGGYQSHTTKSRLNALCDEYCIKGEGVFQKNYQWFVRKFVGAINGQNVFENVLFGVSFVCCFSRYCNRKTYRMLYEYFIER